uniref:Acylphosphatase-like domain-containing protein n=1 Tax=Astyanax mexicanus TaxID=7994 RepID=A0A8B9JLU1_ASTMX
LGLNLLLSVFIIIQYILNNTLAVCLTYTERQGLSLGLVGWVKNTSKGTVVGQVQGPRHQVNEMLQHFQLTEEYPTVLDDVFV